MSGCLPPLNKKQNGQRGHDGTGDGAEDELRERHLAQNQIAPQTNHKADGIERRMLTPSGLADSASNHNPPSTASSETVARSAFNAAYTISTGSKSTCAPSQWRRTGNVASPNTARNATARIRMVCRTFINWVEDEKHPDLFERTEVGGKFHARLGVEAEFNRTRIHHLAYGNALGKNAAHAAGEDVLASLQIRAAGKIGQLDERSVHRAAGADNARVVRRIVNERGDAAIRVANQKDLGTRVADGGNPADQALGGEDRQVFADAVTAAEVNLHGAPPVGWVAQDNITELEFPRRLLLPAEQRVELVVFRARWRQSALPGLCN